MHTEHLAGTDEVAGSCGDGGSWNRWTFLESSGAGNLGTSFLLMAAIFSLKHITRPSSEIWHF